MAKIVFNEDEECLDDISSQDIDQQLRVSIDNLYSAFMDPTGERVDYTGIKGSVEFNEYCRRTAELKQFDVGILNDNQRKAFFLNIYNALVIHGLVQLGEPKTWDDRSLLYSSASYQIGGMVLSLDDIEHGILRGNKVGGSHKEIPFPEGDERASFALDLDPRIHFALNCGAVSCPPIRFYESEEIDEQLDLSTEAYLEDVRIDTFVDTIHLPKLMQWYASDFSPSNSSFEILQWILPFMYEEERSEAIQKMIDSGDFSIEYLPYNWDLNDK